MVGTAPPNHNQSQNLFPEAVLYLLIKDHPIIIQGDSPKRKGVENLKTRPAADADDEEEDEEEKLGKGMTTKGSSFTSRKKQRSSDTRLQRRALVAQEESGIRNEGKGCSDSCLCCQEAGRQSDCTDMIGRSYRIGQQIYDPVHNWGDRFR